MALTRVNTSITFPADGVVGDSGGTLTSDPFELDQTCINAQVHVNSNAGATAGGQILEVYLLQESTGGKFDGARPEHAIPLGSIDSAAGNDEQITAPIPIPQANCRLHVINVGAASTTVTASRTEQRSS